MNIPSFADSKNRTANRPSVLLGIDRTHTLLTQAVRYVQENKLQADPLKVLRDHLLQNGWYRVELQGRQLYLQAVVVYGTESRTLIDKYLAQAEQTGNWNWPAFIKKPEDAFRPHLRLVVDNKEEV